MRGIVLAWFFVSFLYFKIVFDAVFYQDISIIASFLMAITFAILIFFASGVYAMRLFRYNAVPGRVPATLRELIGKTIWPFLGLSIGYAILSRLIIFGFSKNLHREIRAFDYRGNIQEELVQFILIVLAPVLIHYAMCIYPTLYNANRRKYDPLP
jgi:hypothetical protein